MCSSYVSSGGRLLFDLTLTTLAETGYQANSRRGDAQVSVTARKFALGGMPLGFLVPCSAMYYSCRFTVSA